MIDVQITTPVLPKQATEKKLVLAIKKIVQNTNCTVRFFESGIDFYGQQKFDVLVIDGQRNEKDDIRNEVISQIFTELYKN